MIGLGPDISDVDHVVPGELLFELQVPFLNLLVLVVAVDRQRAQAGWRNCRIEVGKSRRRQCGGLSGRLGTAVSRARCGSLTGEGHAIANLRVVTQAAAERNLLTKLVVIPP